MEDRAGYSRRHLQPILPKDIYPMIPNKSRFERERYEMNKVTQENLAESLVLCI